MALGTYCLVVCLSAALSDVVLGKGPNPFLHEGRRNRREMVPAMFIFGDSLIDNGNNNALPSFAKANYLPYGIDYNGGPTGRFSNGYTMVDEVAKLLGLPLIPAFSEAFGDQILHGVNYASAASGILDETGGNFVGRIPFDQQIRNFQITLDQIMMNLGAIDVAEALAKCIFFVGIGSNDYLNNYLMPNYPTRNQYNGQQYADHLVQKYTQQLRTLYNMGARKFVVTGLGRMGCIPSIIAQSNSGHCSEEVNKLMVPFNANVKKMLNGFNGDLRGARFIYVDVAHIFGDIIAHPRTYGFRVVNKGCCGIGRNRGQITCLPLQTPCNKRDEYVFWDAFHPTEKVNILMARKAFNGDRSVVSPINIQQLARL
ncbi:GDSL esterase/lipase [Hibiscus syriacus]|uniref:GDSL esterase/lipase n=1 Tax=Hibiscus syriacus TaxID=106335 RepID=A0A6A2YRP7_HIBSY|nr:GDSL esterase/lipase At1g71691-like [Hibiscus syriacus]KAE8682111.1 GDSL esterase/lipase [Hibiscus syriacus]